MPSGDPQRTWFREMIDHLREEWHADMPFPALIELCSSLDTMLHRIRSERNILTLVMRCQCCGLEVRQPEPRVSVRATILAVSRFGIASRDVTKKIEKEWAKYRKQHGLDLYGNPESEVSQAPNCGHA